MKKTGAFSILVAVLLISAQAVAVTEGDLKKEPKPDDTSVRKLESSLADNSVSEEIAEDDKSAYEAAAKELTIEEQNIRKDIERLQKQIANLKAGKEQAKQNLELVRKKVELQKAQNVAAKKAAAKALAEKLIVDEENSKVSQQLHALEAQERESNEESRKLDYFMKMAREERQEMLKRIQDLKVSLGLAQQTQQTRRGQYDNYRKTTKTYEKQQEQKLQAQAQARTQQPSVVKAPAPVAAPQAPAPQAAPSQESSQSQAQPASAQPPQASASEAETQSSTAEQQTAKPAASTAEPTAVRQAASVNGN